MERIFDHCSQCDCGKKQLIVNKTKYLCDDKNYARLHGGKSRYEVSLEKHKAKQKDKKPIVWKKKPSKPWKTKKRPIDAQYSDMIRKIANDREKICTGCGRHQGGEIRLSNSHIISRKQCQEIGRIDLIADENNVTYHCMDFGEHEGCHRKWEGPRKKELLDYVKNMSYIESIDKSLYSRLKNAADEYQRK